MPGRAVNRRIMQWANSRVTELDAASARIRLALFPSEDAKAPGLVQRAIERGAIHGFEVSPSDRCN